MPQTAAVQYQVPDLTKQADKSNKDGDISKFFPPTESQAKPQPDGPAEVKLSAPQPPQVPSPPTTLFIFSDDGGLLSTTLNDSKVLKAAALCTDAFPVEYSVGPVNKLYWKPQRIKFIPEIGILSFLQSPTKIILIDVFQKYQTILKNLSVSIFVKDISVSKAKLKIETTEFSSGGLGLSFELRHTFEESWADCLDATGLSENSKTPSIGLLTISGILYRFEIQTVLKIDEPDDIYSELRRSNPSDCTSWVQRTLEIDGNIFCIGNFVFD